MSKSKIEWTDRVWNPITGCTKVSPGCANCYAEVQDHRFDHDKVGKLPWAFPANRGGRGVTLHPERLEQPLKWKKPQKVFVNSMSDLFHEDVPDNFVAKVFGIMFQAQRHTFQVLTKRPERMRELLNSERFWWRVAHSGGHGIRIGLDERTTRFLPNLWLGVSVENQHWADRRIPLLLQTPAAVRFLSCEPLLKGLHLQLRHDTSGRDLTNLPGLWDEPDTLVDWVIVGGESGPKARPMNPDWARSIRDDCEEAGVAFFFKQWGEWSRNVVDHNARIAAVAPDGWWKAGPPAGYGREHSGAVEMYRVGKKRAGAMLDGREWREFPTSRV